MSDFCISIVPTVSEYPTRKTKAADVCAWLIAEGIISPEVSDCILSKKLGHSIGERAHKAVNTPSLLPFDLALNGLEIITERTVFPSELEELICPNCKHNIISDEWDLLPWLEQKSTGIICPQCVQEASIQHYAFKPNWGFSNLGFTFWNWPTLTPQFIEKFEARLGCTVLVVHQQI
jgi:hypothetical protein